MVKARAKWWRNQSLNGRMYQREETRGHILIEETIGERVMHLVTDLRGERIHDLELRMNKLESNKGKEGYVRKLRRRRD